MRDDGDAIPSPSSLDDIENVDGSEDVARVLVRASMPAKFSRIQVTLEDSLLAAIDAVAPNRSGFLADAARLHLRDHNRLTERMDNARARVAAASAAEASPKRRKRA